MGLTGVSLEKPTPHPEEPATGRRLEEPAPGLIRGRGPGHFPPGNHLVRYPRQTGM